MEILLSRILELRRQDSSRTAIIMQQAGQADFVISYDQLLKGAAGVTATLEEQNIQPGSVVILVLQHSQALLYGFFGAILHGAIPSIMPFLTEKLSPEKYQADIRALVRITQPAAILTEPAFLSLMQQVAGPETSVHAVVDITTCSPAQSLPDDDRLRGLGRSPQDIVLLQHSSGTTGLQKGVALSHQAVFNQLDNLRTALESYQRYAHAIESYNEAIAQKMISRTVYWWNTSFNNWNWSSQRTVQLKPWQGYWIKAKNDTGCWIKMMLVASYRLPVEPA